MKKILSLIVLVVFIASCTNDDSDEILNKELQKIEQANNSQQFAKDETVPGDNIDTVATPPPPPVYNEPGESCDTCPIDPPKGGTKP